MPGGLLLIHLAVLIRTSNDKENCFVNCWGSSLWPLLPKHILFHLPCC